jgi:hypothetical protein
LNWPSAIVAMISSFPIVALLPCARIVLAGIIALVAFASLPTIV